MFVASDHINIIRFYCHFRWGATKMENLKAQKSGYSVYLVMNQPSDAISHTCLHSSTHAHQAANVHHTVQLQNNSWWRTKRTKLYPMARRTSRSSSPLPGRKLLTMPRLFGRKPWDISFFTRNVSESSDFRRCEKVDPTKCWGILC